MSVTRYFEKFPQMIYNGYNALDIVSNAKLVERIINSPYTYYPYELTREQRPDVIAHQYYDDPYFSWLVYYGNKIVDPYYDWNLPDNEFNSHLVSKYGSVELSQKRVAFYRTNWYNDDRQISPNLFNNTIGSHEVKYWEKKFNEDAGVLLYYYRKPLDIKVNTNQIITFSVENTGSFVSGDLVDIRRSSQDIGTAEIITSNASSLSIKNIYLTQGEIVAGDIIRHDSNTLVSSVVQSEIGKVVNIPLSEMNYWEPVTYFEYETEMNAERKIIKLIDNRLSMIVDEALSDAMR